MNGDVDEAVVLFEEIKERAPKLVLSVLAQKQLEYISDTLEETSPEPLAVTENHTVKSNRKVKIVGRIAYCVGILLILGGIILTQLDSPKQENKDPDYIAQIESSIKDDYEEYQILGYFNIYTEYREENYFNEESFHFIVKE